MSNMKCPVCKTGNVEQDKCNKECFCDNEFCPSYDEIGSNTYNVLIRTRKALDVAVNVLKWIHETYNLGMGYEAAIMEKCEFTIEQITALEQKDE